MMSISTKICMSSALCLLVAACGTPRERATHLAEDGARQHARGRWGDAVESYREALVEYPGHQTAVEGLHASCVALYDHERVGDH